MSHEHPVFSVVMPLYNKVEYVGAALDSVLAQAMDSYEVIVVDDGSMDGGPDVVVGYADRGSEAGYADGRIRLHRQKNAGAAAARNAGIELARAPYIAFLDADDWWEPHYLQTVYDLICCYPEAGLYATASRRVYPDGRHEPIVGDIEGLIDNYFRLVANRNVVWTGATVVPMSTFRAVGGFREDMRRGEDLELWARIGCSFAVAYRGEICANYRQNVPGQLTDTHGRSGGGRMVSRFRALIARSDRFDESDPYVQEFLERWSLLGALGRLRGGAPGTRVRELLAVCQGRYRMHALVVRVASYLPRWLGGRVVELGFAVNRWLRG